MSQPKEAQAILFDGLVEASHYLCKLGTNLDRRSTNFKNDKIIKANLANKEDMKGAIDKVLQICDLAKKSLDNVESGVRKVIQDYERSLKCQSKSRENVKGQNDRNTAAKQTWYTFEYDNIVLKISKKICISHYTSAQVLLQSLNQTNKEFEPTKTTVSVSSISRGKKQRHTSSDFKKTNKIENASSLKKENRLKECKKISHLDTEDLMRTKSKKIKAKNINNDKTTCSENLEILSTQKNSEITAAVETAGLQSQKSSSEGPVNLKNEILKDKKKANNDEKQEDDMAEKSLGKLTCTGGKNNNLIKCVDINKLIDKAKELNCRLHFKSHDKKCDGHAKVEMKNNTSLPLASSKSRIDFINKPLSINIKRLHNNLQIYKDQFNLKNIVYRNKEISNLNEGIANNKDSDSLIHLNNKLKDQDNISNKMETELNTHPKSNNLKDDYEKTSSDFELRYSDTYDESDIDNEELAVLMDNGLASVEDQYELDCKKKKCEKLDVAHENESDKVKTSKARNKLNNSDSNASHLDKNIRTIKVSLVHSDSSGEETVIVTQTRATSKLRLYSPNTKKRLGMSSSSSSSSSSSDYFGTIKKVRHSNFMNTD